MNLLKHSSNNNHTKYIFISIYRSRSSSEKLWSNRKSFIKIKSNKKCKFEENFGFLMQQHKPGLDSGFTNFFYTPKIPSAISPGLKWEIENENLKLFWGNENKFIT